MSGSERHRALLDERSAALAARGHAEERAVAHRDFLVCTVTGERYGFALAETAAVMPERPCTPVPGAPAALRGIVAHAGIVVSVIDLARALGLAAGADAPEGGHFLRLRADDPPVALAVDRVLGVARVGAEGIEPSPLGDDGDPGTGLGAGAVSGYAPAAADRDRALRDAFAIIDLPRLLRPFLP